MKKLIIFLLVVLLIVAALAKDALIEMYTEKVLTDILGVKVDIGRMTVGFPRTYIDMQDIVVYNPSGYDDKVMGKIDELYIDYDGKKLLKRTLHLTELKFYLKELNFVKDKEGALNLNQITPINKKEGGEELEDEHPFFIPRLHIDKLHLRGGRITYKDYSRRVKPAVHTFNVAVDAVYYDIDDPYTLVRLIVSQTIRNTMVSNIIQVPMNGVSGIIEASANTMNNVVRSEGPIRSTVDNIKEGLLQGGWFGWGGKEPSGEYST